MTPRDSSLASRPATSLYFINAPVDWLFVGFGSLLTFGLVWALQDVLKTATIKHALLYYLIFIGNGPHFSATNFRLYRSLAHIRQYPFTALAVPFLVMAGILASLVWPAWIAPCFIKLYLLWSPYHYSGQSVGITKLYARRAGHEIGKWEGLALSGFIYGTFITSTAQAEVGSPKLDFFGIGFPALGFPSWVALSLEGAMWACGLAFLGLALVRAIPRKQRLPPILLIPAATQYAWFMAGPKHPAFFQLVPFFHGIQYLLIAWFMQLRERSEERQKVPGVSGLAWQTLWWGAANIAGGGLLFWGLPMAVSQMLGTSPFLTLPIVLAGVQIHHFFVDGVIWKLRDPRVGSPLLGNLDDLLVSRAPVPRRAAA